jgi:Xaa-Pro aminopeptidase
LDLKLRLLAKMKENKVEALILGKPANIRYISGFTSADTYLLVTEDKNYMIADGRYVEQVKNECKDVETVYWDKTRRSLGDEIGKLVEELEIKRLGFEENYLTYEQYSVIKKKINDTEFIPTNSLVEELRMIKTNYEIECIKKAASFADTAFGKILDVIKPGMTERELALELEYNLKKAGSQGTSSSIIFVSGARTSLLHGVPSDKKIEKGDFITMDFGGLYKGYRSDMTRTIVVGKANSKQKEIYNIIKEAQKTGLKALKPGVSGKYPDDEIRKIIKETGYIQYYYEGLGHGLGLEIHEKPYMGDTCEETLQSGYVVTMEPGLYIPGWGGVRIEDTVSISGQNNEILTKSTKELIEL